MSLRDDLRARVTFETLDSYPAHITAKLRDGDRVFDASAQKEGDETYERLAVLVVAQAIAARGLAHIFGTGVTTELAASIVEVPPDPEQPFDALRIRCHPVLEGYARARWRPQQWVFDPAMAPDRVEVTPFAYAENIQVEIGFNGPKLPGDD